jgi:hypothetical protein
MVRPNSDVSFNSSKSPSRWATRAADHRTPPVELADLAARAAAPCRGVRPPACSGPCRSRGRRTAAPAVDPSHPSPAALRHRLAVPAATWQVFPRAPQWEPRRAELWLALRPLASPCPSTLPRADALAAALVDLLLRRWAAQRGARRAQAEPVAEALPESALGIRSASDASVSRSDPTSCNSGSTRRRRSRAAAKADLAPADSAEHDGTVPRGIVAARRRLLQRPSSPAVQSR